MHTKPGLRVFWQWIPDSRRPHIATLISCITMSVDSTNPYQPPSVPGRHIGSPTTAASRAITFCVPPILTIGCTLIFWLGFASVLGQTVASFNARALMFVWSATLVVSVAVSAYLIIRVWPHQLSAVSMSVGFVLFGVGFWLVEGDTSNGTDLLHMSILYGTLMALPLMAFVMTRHLERRRHADATERARD